MGIKHLAGWLAMISGVMSFGLVGGIAMMHDVLGLASKHEAELSWAFTPTLVMLYFVVILGVLMATLGALALCLKQKNTLVVWALLTLTVCALAASITAAVFMPIAFETVLLFTQFLVVITIQIAIIVLSTCFIIFSRDKTKKQIKILKRLREDGVLSDEEYKEKALALAGMSL